MRSWTLAITMAVVSLVIIGSAAGQATVEGALTHALSSSAGTGVGKAMGRATGQLAGKLGKQTSSVAPRQNLGAVKNSPRALARVTPAATSAARPASDSLIVSIQGAEPMRTSCPPAQTSGTTKTEAGTQEIKDKDVDANSTSSDCAKQPSRPADSHPAMVTLPAIK
jgi:hypothetical protein